MIEQLNIDGIGQSHYTTVIEYVPTVVSTAYTSALVAIQTVLNKANPTSADYDDLYNAIDQIRTLAQSGVSDPNSPHVKYYITNDMANALQNVMRTLQTAEIPLTPSVATSAVKEELMQQFANRWLDLKGFGIDQVLTNALNVYGGIDASAATSRSLQSMIELDYVKVGNDLLLSSLAALEKALQSNQNSLDTLRIIQDISNKIQVKSSGNFVFPPTNYGDIPSSLLNIFISKTGDRFTVPSASALSSTQFYLNPLPNGGVLNKQFIQDYIAAGGTPPIIRILSTAINPSDALAWTTYPPGSDRLIDPDISRWSFTVPNTLPDALKTQTGFASGISKTANLNVSSFTYLYKIAASTYFTQQQVISTATQADADSLYAAMNTLKNNIASVEALSVSPANDRNIPNTLAYFLNQVVIGLSAAFALPDLTRLQAANSWILDGQNVLLSQNATIGGANQLNVSQAITAAQSLNDSQKQEVQKAMFIFQEFYKSSSAVLQKVNDIINRMAQTISR